MRIWPPWGSTKSREAIEQGGYVLTECAGAAEEINREIDRQLAQAEQDYHDALEAQKSSPAQGEVQEQYYLAPSDMAEFVVEDPEREYSEQVELLEETRQKKLEQLYQETLAGQLADMIWPRPGRTPCRASTFSPCWVKTASLRATRGWTPCSGMWRSMVRFPNCGRGATSYRST